jgi:hypothetical protein
MLIFIQISTVLLKTENVQSRIPSYTMSFYTILSGLKLGTAEIFVRRSTAGTAFHISLIYYESRSNHLIICCISPDPDPVPHWSGQGFCLDWLVTISQTDSTRVAYSSIHLNKTIILRETMAIQSVCRKMGLPTSCSN